MKIFILWIIPFVIFASGQSMSVSDTLYFERADKQPLKLKYPQKVRMNQLSKIDEEKAKSIIKELTQQETQSIKLTTSGKYLIYNASTRNYNLVINALDGTLIQKESK
ncbi:MAG: hypothetical protein AB7D38_05445 [Sulfurimonas sp.]|uniref:hypothetical protein n=1 Tax=Sulfurimonas sp. TaxID=2022749 RepID=UPI003D0A18E8